MIQSKEDILKGIEQNYSLFLEAISSFSEQKFAQIPPDGKWSVGQHLDHLIRSTKPLNMVLDFPIILRIFGKANRPSRSFDELVAKYQGVLEAGGVATGRYIPAIILGEQKKKMMSELEKQKLKLKKNIDSWSESLLDRVVIPHPLIGKLTAREMMFFTIYHTSHHLKIIQKMGH
jgi:DinB superfamily